MTIYKKILNIYYHIFIPALIVILSFFTILFSFLQNNQSSNFAKAQLGNIYVLSEMEQFKTYYEYLDYGLIEESNIVKMQIENTFLSLIENNKLNRSAYRRVIFYNKTNGDYIYFRR